MLVNVSVETLLRQPMFSSLLPNATKDAQGTLVRCAEEAGG